MTTKVSELTQVLQSAYNSGRRAFQAGKIILDCPFRNDKRMAFFWRAGFNQDVHSLEELSREYEETRRPRRRP